MRLFSTGIFLFAAGFYAVCLTRHAAVSEKIAAQVQRQTVAVDVAASGFMGSGICAGRYVWTAAHNFDAATEAPVSDVCKVHTIHGVTARCKLVVFDRATDIAVLELPAGVSVEGAEWFDGTAPVGRRVYVVGTPKGALCTVTRGIVTGVSRKVEGWTTKLDGTDAAIDNGSSGGGVYSAKDGKLLGMTVGGVSNTQNYFVPVRELRLFAEAHKLPLSGK